MLILKGDIIGHFHSVLVFSVISKVYTATCLTLVIMFKFVFFFNKTFAPHLVPVPGVCVSKPLDVVEDQPREGDDHQDDEGDGDEHDRSAAHVFLQVAGSDGDVHRHGDVSFQQADDLLPFQLGDHYGHDVFHACCQGGKGRAIRGRGREGEENNSEMSG